MCDKRWRHGTEDTRTAADKHHLHPSVWPWSPVFSLNQLVRRAQRTSAEAAPIFTVLRCDANGVMKVLVGEEANPVKKWRCLRPHLSLSHFQPDQMISVSPADTPQFISTSHKRI